MKQMVAKIKEILADSNLETFLVFPHVMPDGDTIGSAIGIHRLIKGFGKEGYIVLNDDIPSNLLFLKDPLIWKRSDEVTMDTPAIGIAVDCGEVKLFEDRYPLFKSAKHTISIDHHLTNSMYAEINIVDSKASSTGELIYSMYKEFDVEIDSVTAEALYAAITTDTGGFRYSNTNPDTFAACSELVASGFDFNRLNVEIFQNKPFEKVKLLNEVFATLDLFLNGKAALVVLSESMMDRLNYATYDTDGIVEFVRDIEGVEVVVFIRYMGHGSHKVSMRSKNEFDVSKIALAFSGGGHRKAAGFKSDLSLEALIEALKKAVEGAFHVES